MVRIRGNEIYLSESEKYGGMTNYGDTLLLENSVLQWLRNWPGYFHLLKQQVIACETCGRVARNTFFSPSECSNPNASYR